jgi:hypothetical protein
MQIDQLKPREFISLPGGEAGACTLAPQAQQRKARCDRRNAVRHRDLRDLSAFKSEQASAIIGNRIFLERRLLWRAKEKTDGAGESFCEVPLLPGRQSFSV